MDMMKMTGFGLDLIGETVGERDLNTDDLISTKLLVLDFLRENIKEDNIEKRKERVYEFFKEAPNAQVPEDVCKPSVDFRKKFILQQKKSGPEVPQSKDVFASFSPFHMAVMCLPSMNNIEEKNKLSEILKSRMKKDKNFAKDALFTEVDNGGLFSEVLMF